MSQVSRVNKRRAAQKAEPSSTAQVVAGKFDGVSREMYFEILRKAAVTRTALEELLYSEDADAAELMDTIAELGFEVISDTSQVNYCNGLDPTNKFGQIEFRDPELDWVVFWVTVCVQGGTSPYGSGRAYVSDHVDIDLYWHIFPEKA